MPDSGTLNYWQFGELPGGGPDGLGSGTLNYWQFEELPPWLMPGEGGAPNAPTDCYAECSFSTRCATIFWTDVATDETGYEVQRREGTGAWRLVAELDPDTETYQDCNVGLARTYTYRIRAVNAAGESDWCTTNEVYCLFAQEWIDAALEASYMMAIRDTNGVLLALMDSYDSLDYTRIINDQGYYEFIASTATVDPDNFGTDYIFEVLRAAPGQDWGEDFAGFHRLHEFSFDDEDKEWFKSVGPGVANLIWRRHIMPTAGNSFVAISDEFTDIMRELVRTQCGSSASAARQFLGLTVEDDSHEGVALSLNYRFTELHKEIKVLSELGADFEVAHTGGAEFEFRVHYPSLGLDCRIGNADGNPPVIFSIEMANMEKPIITDDRLEEKTVVYVAGEGVGANREIVERSSLFGAENDSPWNRVEGFLEARQETSTGSLMALGDAFLAINREGLTFECRAIPTPACLYGVDWDLGYLVTGYYRDVEYDMQVIEVNVKVNADGGEVITPTFEVTGRGVTPWPYWT